MLNPTREVVSRGRNDQQQNQGYVRNQPIQQRGRSQGFNIINHSSGPETNNYNPYRNNNVNNNNIDNSNTKVVSLYKNQNYYQDPLQKVSNNARDIVRHNRDEVRNPQFEQNQYNEYAYGREAVDTNVNLNNPQGVPEQGVLSDEEYYREYLKNMSPEEREQIYKTMLENYTPNIQKPPSECQEEQSRVPNTMNEYEAYMKNQSNVPNQNYNSYQGREQVNPSNIPNKNNPYDNQIDYRNEGRQYQVGDPYHIENQNYKQSEQVNFV